MNESLSTARRAEIIAQFARRTILVIGDLMVDEYLRGTARRISQEGPVMVIEVESDEFKPGGAANVAHNLCALGGRVALVGITGDDEMGRLLRSALQVWNVDVSGIVTDPTRPTTRKTRIVAQNQQVMRIDREQTQAVSEEISRRLLKHVEHLLPGMDAVLVSDYRKGVVTEETARSLCTMARDSGKPLISNPKPASAPWLQGARVLSLNQLEAEDFAAARMPDEDSLLRPFGERIARRLEVDTLMITRGGRGVCLWLRNGTYYRIPGHTVEVADIAGAGDTTIGTMTMALASGASDYEAAEIANLAGATVVRKFGVATISPDELLHAL